MNRGEKLGILIDLERNSKTNPRNKKSLDLDQDLQRNQRVKIRKKINREEREI